MSMLKNIHNYVKKNYEAGNYENAKVAYTSWKKESNQLSDFEMGVKKAQSDYKLRGLFSTYPVLTVGAVNKLFDDKALEISEFIRGYNYEKRRIRNHY